MDSEKTVRVRRPMRIFALCKCLKTPVLVVLLFLVMFTRLSQYCHSIYGELIHLKGT